MLFKDLCLSQPVLQAVENAGYHEASPVQAEAIPAVLSGKDLLVGAKTGTGKTAAFALPVLDQLLNGNSQVQSDKKVIKALVLVPTRELAQQVNNSFKKYSPSLKKCVGHG